MLHPTAVLFLPYILFDRFYVPYPKPNPNPNPDPNQVNYTRKVQHFAAYLVPLLFSPSKDCDCRGTLEVLNAELIWN